MSFLFKAFCIHIHQKQVKQCQTDLLAPQTTEKTSPKTTHHRHNRRGARSQLWWDRVRCRFLARSSRHWLMVTALTFQLLRSSKIAGPRTFTEHPSFFNGEMRWTGFWKFRISSGHGSSGKNDGWNQCLWNKRIIPFRSALGSGSASCWRDFLYRHFKKLMDSYGFMDRLKWRKPDTRCHWLLELFFVIPSHINLYCGKRIGRCVVGSVEKRLLQDPKASKNAGLIRFRCSFSKDFANITIWVFPKIGVLQHGWFIMENPIKMGWFGGTTI